MIRTYRARSLLMSLLVPCALAGGCIFTTGEAEDSDSADETSGGSNPTTTVGFSTTTSPSSTDASSADETIGETTASPMGECSDNLLADGGFEGGTPSRSWTESSTNFGTPICDTECTMDPGADPYVGDWYCWFGGIDTDPEVATVSQEVRIDGPNAYLSFRFQINAAAGTGDDYFFVQIDDATVFMVTDAEIDDYAGYTPVSLDISDYADGMPHTISFTGDFLGEGELSNFFLDETELISCSDGTDTTGPGTSGTTNADESSTGGSSESGTTASDDTTSSGSSDSGTSTDSGSTTGNGDG